MKDSLPPDESSLRLALVELLKKILGSQVRLGSLEISKDLYDYRVALLDLDQPPHLLVVKMAGPQPALACPFDRTAALLELVSQRTRVPVAQVLGVDVSCQQWPWRYLVTTRQPGQQWVRVQPQLDGTSLNFAYAQLGEAIAQLHAIQFPAFGELSPSLAPDADNDFVSAWKRRAQAFIPQPRLREAFLEALEPRLELFSSPETASLCHEDLHGYNILFERQPDGWQLASILDFDKAWAGSRESDLARLEFWDGMTNPSFWQAYQANLPLDTNGYAQRRPLFQLFWCLEYAATTPRHQADTARVCRQLGVPMIHLE